MIDTLQSVLGSPSVLIAWALLTLGCVAWTAWDLATRNRPIGGLIRWCGS
jgi:hypothetical protein